MRPFYGPTYNPGKGSQSAYDQGLTWFPDGPSFVVAAEPLGDIASILGMVAGGAVAGPVGATAGGSLPSLFGSLVGGTAVDQARQARVNYVLQAAANGNVAAAQIILGAPPNVSGNEQQMWIDAATSLRQAAPDVYAEAQQAGPAWLPNSGDTATNYPALRNYLQTWAAQHPLSTLTSVAASTFGSVFGPSAPSGVLAPRSTGIPAYVWIIGGVVAYAAFRRRRS
jgi:hypothetical protein